MPRIGHPSGRACHQAHRWVDRLGLGLFLGGSSLSWLILLYGLGPEWPYGPLGWSIASAVVALVGLVPLCSGVKGMASKVDELYLRRGR